MKRNPSIKIISGFNKGLKINFKPSIDLRPTSNRLKKVLFDWIQFELKDSVCLDLFAGTGNLGLECISRGAKKVIFVEHNREYAKKLDMSIHKINSKDKAKIYETDSINWIKECEVIFDHIFLDPPFDFQKLSQVLKFIDNKRLLKTSGKIFIESPKTIHPIEMKNFKVIKEKIVGDVKGQLIKWK